MSTLFRKELIARICTRDLVNLARQLITQLRDIAGRLELMLQTIQCQKTKYRDGSVENPWPLSDAEF